MSAERDLLECDALIQYEDGKWASISRYLIPAQVVNAAIAAYDPMRKSRFNTNYMGRPKSAICTNCGSTRPRFLKTRLLDRLWRCPDCCQKFSVPRDESL